MKNILSKMVNVRGIRRLTAVILTIAIIGGFLSPIEEVFAASGKYWETEYFMEVDGGIPIGDEEGILYLDVEEGQTVNFHMLLREKNTEGSKRFKEKFSIIMPDTLYDRMIEDSDIFQGGWLDYDNTDCGYLLEAVDPDTGDATSSNATRSNATRSDASYSYATDSNSPADRKLTFRFAEELRKEKQPENISVEEAEGILSFTAPVDGRLTITRDGNDCRIEMTGAGEELDNRSTNSISGMIWLEDTSSAAGDGVYDSAAETTVEGFTLSLYKADDTSTKIGAAVTDVNGEYTFSNLEDGDYIVGFTAQTLDDVEYLVPLNGITGDNKFAIENTWTQVLTETITLSGGTDALNYSAGVRGIPKAAPVTGTYIVTRDDTGEQIGSTYTDLASAVTACLTTVPCTITATADDPAMGEMVTIPSEKTITLTSDSGESYTITQQATSTTSFSGGRHFYVSGSLTLENITLSGMGFTSGSYNGGVFIYSGSLTMNSGAAIEKCYHDDGGVFVSRQGTFTMSGGTISGNTASYGGGVNSQGTFTMSGGTISGNTASSGGGGVTITNNATFNMSGGTISNNTASHNGGGVNSHGTFTMSGGIISGNTASSGGGVASVYSTFTMSGGTISGNTASDGGGVNSNGTFTMSGGTISGNTASYDGGGVYSLGTFTMSGGTISGNTASSKGGGVLILSGTFTMSETATIRDNSATGKYSYGGGVYIAYGTTFTTFNMSGGTIQDNSATGKYSDGGGVYVSYGTFTMSGGTISGNTASSKGGGVYSDQAWSMTNGSITGNSAEYGGGVYQDHKSYVFTMSGGSITNNTATTDGGGIYSLDYSYTATPNASSSYRNIGISGGTVSGNTSGYTSSPPTNASDFTSRTTNPFNGNLLTNDEINYREPYDINSYTVTVEYVDRQGNSLLTAATATAPSDTSYTAAAPAIPGYVFADWKQDGGGLQGNTSPVITVPAYDTTISLIYGYDRGNTGDAATGGTPDGIEDILITKEYKNSAGETIQTGTARVLNVGDSFNDVHDTISGYVIYHGYRINGGATQTGEPDFTVAAGDIDTTVTYIYDTIRSSRSQSSGTSTSGDGSVSGAWIKVAGEEIDKWRFVSNGSYYTSRWAYIYNPYADTEQGQPTTGWFVFDADSYMIAGWYTDATGCVYYLNPVPDNTQGMMFTGWHRIDGKWYYFNEAGTEALPYGALLRSTTTPDGYEVNDLGQRVE